MSYDQSGFHAGTVYHRNVTRNIKTKYKIKSRIKTVTAKFMYIYHST